MFKDVQKQQQQQQKAYLAVHHNIPKTLIIMA